MWWKNMKGMIRRLLQCIGISPRRGYGHEAGARLMRARMPRGAKDPFGYFDKVFVVTLERNQNRKERMRSQFNHLGIDAEFINGMDGSQYDEEDLVRRFHERNIIKRAHRRLTPGQLGCALSHILTYERILADRYQRVLICQDDMEFVKGVHKKLRQCLDEISGDPVNGVWDIIHFHSFRPLEEVDRRFSVKKMDYPVHNPKGEAGLMTHREWIRSAETGHVFKGGREYVRRSDGGYLRYVYKGCDEFGGAVCYALTYQAAKKLLGIPLMTTADGLIGMLSSTLPGHARFSGKAYVVSPFLCRPSQVESVIDRIDREQGVSRKALRDR